MKGILQQCTIKYLLLCTSIKVQPVLIKGYVGHKSACGKEYTMIKWSTNENSKLTVSLFDASGRFILCRQYWLRKGENELLLTNLEALPAGEYFIKASDGANYRNGKLTIQQ